MEHITEFEDFISEETRFTGKNIDVPEEHWEREILKVAKYQGLKPDLADKLAKFYIAHIDRYDVVYIKDWIKKIKKKRAWKKEDKETKKALMVAGFTKSELTR